jgi:hypothetical protein
MQLPFPRFTRACIRRCRTSGGWCSTWLISTLQALPQRFRRRLMYPLSGCGAAAPQPSSRDCLTFFTQRRRPRQARAGPPHPILSRRRGVFVHCSRGRRVKATGGLPGGLPGVYQAQVGEKGPAAHPAKAGAVPLRRRPLDALHCIGIPGNAATPPKCNASRFIFPFPLFILVLLARAPKATLFRDFCVDASHGRCRFTVQAMRAAFSTGSCVSLWQRRQRVPSATLVGNIFFVPFLFPTFFPSDFQRYRDAAQDG